MAAKKTNYVEYELEWLEKKIKSLREYVDKRPFEDIKDRIEVLESSRGNPIIKVIASEEIQIKSLKDILKELPGMFEALNRLRKLADDKGEDISKRGGGDLPGIFKNKLLGNGNKKKDDDDEEDEEDDY